jgi:outer membrane protein assembly factor BamA
MVTALLVCLLVSSLEQAPAAQPTDEFVADVRVHGNHTTPDADILALAGLATGERLGAGRLEAVENQLRASGRFTEVEVRKRYASITDPTAILIVILVNELPSTSADDPIPGPMRRITGAGMWLPVLKYEDGYGFTYGAQVSFIDPLGASSRVSIPLTWGGERQAALNLERTFTRGPITRITGGGGIHRRENPFYEIGDTRRGGNVRAERAFTTWLRAGGDARIEQVSFGEPDPSSAWGSDERQWTGGVDVTVDTRIDPAFPRNAVYFTGGWQHLGFEDRSAGRWSSTAAGYVGLPAGTVLALRAQTSQADRALPPWEQALLGGGSTLRGYRAGWRAGDNFAAASGELRIPLTSPLNVGRFGVRAFVDTGTTWMTGETLRRSRWDRGIGGGVFLGATIFNASLDVAWPESGGPRWHVGLGVTF